jgi:hypothetical protein
MTEPSDRSWESPEEVLKREIEELERPFARSWYTWIASLAVAAVLGGVLTQLLLSPGRIASLVPRTVSLIQPRSGTLAEVPRSFEWSAVSGAAAYIVSVTQADNGEVVMLRSTTEPRLTTLDTEVSRFDAGRYVWAVEAHRTDGSSLGRGDGAFRLTTGE